MCGIAGFLAPKNRPVLESMCHSLIHRGPDEFGFYDDDDASLSMRRLSIIDIASGHQPISNETGDVWVVFNGEIYNYESLRKTLIGHGHQFRTHSDTETIVHAYEQFGLDFVDHLRGMFAIAIWDRTRRRLVLSRDRLGEKPLFIARSGAHLYFGSEIKAILQAIPTPGVDPQGICDFLSTSYVVAPRTFYDGIEKVAPGEQIIVENGQLRKRRFWAIQNTERTDLGYADAVDQLDEELQKTIQLCLKSDVEVAAFLSGGIDSSLIVAMMARHNVDLQTFSVGYTGAASGFNELNYAKIVSDHVGTTHHELILDPDSNIRLLPKIIYHYDEPHGEPTSMLVYLLCQFVQQQVKVALSGTGGDEIFYGYPRHVGLRYLAYYNRIPRFLRVHAIERIADSLPESTKGRHFLKRAKRFIAGASLPAAEAYCSWLNLLQPELLSTVLGNAIKSSAECETGDKFLRTELLANCNRSLLDRVAVVDTTAYLPEYQLAYMDRMSMANSLEVRAPLCDYRLAEFAMSLPPDFRLKGTRTKHILKDVAARYLPAQIVERKKVGFDSPIGQWFKEDLHPFLNNFLSEDNVRQSQLLEPKAVRSMIDAHCSGRNNYSLQLWSIVSLEAWYRMYIESDISPSADLTLPQLRGGATGGEPGAHYG